VEWVLPDQSNVKRAGGVSLLAGFLYAVHWMRRAPNRLVCLVKGHDTVLHFERHRLALRCITCGRRTAGWVIDR
jgi:hypothetical protein